MYASLVILAWLFASGVALLCAGYLPWLPWLPWGQWHHSSSPLAAQTALCPTRLVPIHHFRHKPRWATFRKTVASAFFSVRDTNSRLLVVAVGTADLPDTPHHLSVSSDADLVSFKPVPSRWMHSAVTKHLYVRNLALNIQTERPLAVFKCQVPARHASTWQFHLL